MALTNEDLKAIADLIDSKLDQKLEPINQRLDKVESKLETMHVWQKKNYERLEELQVSQKIFELNANKKLARLQDGMDTMEEILKLNDLIPR